MSSLRHAVVLEQPNRTIKAERACEGTHLVIGGLGASAARAGLGADNSYRAEAAVEAAIQAILAERESRGVRIPVVTLMVVSRQDADWVEPAIRWLSDRGRRVIVRTRVVLPKPVVRALTEARERGPGVAVELELAHHKPTIQRALLGAEADSASALLLQAQHLETLELPVIARLAPLMPGIHDQKGGFEPLLRNVEAADVRRVVLEVGELRPEQIPALVQIQRELSTAGLLELAKAYAVDPMLILGGLPSEGRDGLSIRKLKPRRAEVLTHALEQAVAAAGLELPTCGCQAHCELARPRAANEYEIGYESVMGRDLFAGLGAI